jgi:hypothetical protein
MKWLCYSNAYDEIYSINIPVKSADKWNKDIYYPVLTLYSDDFKIHGNQIQLLFSTDKDTNHGCTESFDVYELLYGQDPITDRLITIHGTLINLEEVIEWIKRKFSKRELVSRITSPHQKASQT